MLVSAYRLLTADQLVSDAPTLLCGYLLNASADGGVVTIYDGHDTLSGIIAARVVGSLNNGLPVNFIPPILLNNGMYIDMGANVTDFTVYYIPLRGNSPLRPYAPFVMSESDMTNG